MLPTKRFLSGLILVVLMFSFSACSETNADKYLPSPSSSIGTASPSPSAGLNKSGSESAAPDPVYSLAPVEQNAKGNKQGEYYEIFVRSFADSNGDGIGDITGLISKLDYLNDGNPGTTSDLGITGIWLMPVNKTASYHGYDVTDYYDINPEYGTLADFEKLIEESHSRGISVMMDLVLNHTSDRNKWFIQSQDPDSPYRNWYHWTVDGSEGYNLSAAVWGHKAWNMLNGAYYLGLFYSGMPDLNYDNPDVRSEVKNIASFWLGKGVDGFRLDAVPHIYGAGELPNNQSGIEKTVEWWNEFTTYCHKVKPGCLIVGEVLENNVATRATYLPSLDSTFHVGLGDQVAGALKAGASKNDYLAKYIANDYARYAEANPGYIDAPMLSNHDQNRIIGLVQGKWDLMKVAASIYFTVEGVPFIYYGEEIGMFGAKPDEDIRLPFVWGGGDPAQTSWRVNKYEKADISACDQQNDPDSLLTHYKRLIRVRNENEALYAGKYRAISSSNDAIVAYGMDSANQSAILLHNLSRTSQTIQLDTSGYKLEFCQTMQGFEIKSGKVVLPPLSSVIFIK